MKKNSVMLVDDHQIVIDGISALLEHSEDFYIISKTTSPLSALQELHERKPDMVLTDIHMPGMSGIEFTQKAIALAPNIKIIVLSMSDDPSIISEMIHAGAKGYLLKNTGKSELTTALKTVMSGQVYYSAEIASSLANLLHRQVEKQTPGKTSLTQREKEILNLIVKEKSNAQIASELFISERTVETHRKNIFRKTGAKSVVGLVKYALEHGMLS